MVFVSGASALHQSIYYCWIDSKVRLLRPMSFLFKNQQAACIGGIKDVECAHR